MSQTGRPPEAAPALLYEDPETGIKYLDDEPFDIDGSNSNFKEGVALATAEALPACTYANGTAGDGATLTADSNGRLNIDGVDAVNNQRVLIANEVATATNGIYTVTEQGSAGTAFVLTRAVDFNASTDIKNGASVRCANGDDNAGVTFSVTSQSNPILGTNPITFEANASGGGGGSLTKATGAEVDTGTDDEKYITPKAMADSDYIKEADLPAAMPALRYAAKLSDFGNATLNTVELENELGLGPIVWSKQSDGYFETGSLGTGDLTNRLVVIPPIPHYSAFQGGAIRAIDASVHWDEDNDITIIQLSTGESSFVTPTMDYAPNILTGEFIQILLYPA